MSLLNQSPDEFELMLLRSLERMSNATVEFITESSGDPVMIVVVVVCAVGAIVFCLCMIRCVLILILFFFFKFFLKTFFFKVQ